MLLVVSFFVLTGCSGLGSSNSSADWNSSFVVMDGYMYTISDEYVEEVEREIGEVTYYSDMEGTYSGNFSNAFKKGTKYFSIVGVSNEEAIAIEEQNGRYRKAINNGKYGE